MATLSALPDGRFAGHYDQDVDIAWIRFEGYHGATAVSAEQSWGLEERDPESGRVVAVEIWRASNLLPAALLSLLPPPHASRPAAAFEELVESSLGWLSEHYWDQPFWLERDLVWMLQKCLADAAERTEAGVRVLHNFRTSAGHVDLAVVREDQPLIIIECKYEPARNRPDFVSQRLDQPVVFWDHNGVLEDIRRVTTAVAAGEAAAGYALFFDEGGRFRHRDAPPTSRWLDWVSSRGDVAVLLTHINSINVRAARAWAEASAVSTAVAERRSTLSPSDLAAALDALVGRDREVIEARIAGATQAQVAEKLSISAARVAQIEQRARKRLADAGISSRSLGLPTSGRRGRPARGSA